MRHNGWYWLGSVCSSVGLSVRVNDFYTVSGEDMRKINLKLRAKMHEGHHIDNHNHPAMACIRNNNRWSYMVTYNYG